MHRTIGHSWQPPIHKGFTLVEVLLVIVVIVILALVGVVTYNGMRERAERVTITEALSHAETFITQYEVKHGSLPASLDDAGISSAEGETTLQYYRIDDPAGYCIAGTNGTNSYFMNDTDTRQPAEGSCPEL